MSEHVHELQDAEPETYKKPKLPTSSIYHERVYRSAIRLAKRAEPLEKWNGPRRGSGYMRLVRQVKALRDEFINDVDAAIRDGAMSENRKGVA